jgi:tetratricopeptide (TPR) repeat protein
MKRNLLLPGIEVESAGEEIGLQRFVKVEIKTVRVVDPISRSVGEAAYTPLPDDVEDDDIVELVFENGERSWKQWMTVDQLREISQPQSSRSAEGQPERVLVPQTWEAKDTSRGWGTIALRALKIFGIDLAEELTEKAAQKVAAAVADRFESQIEQQGHAFGLYRLADPLKIGARVLVQDVKKLAGGGPYLIFLHGTASSSVGSFAKLAGTKEWEQLQRQYGERILALEHRTFSVSPIQNALDLTKLIPDGARLHLISHSRGGLVGELMCLAQAGGCRAKFNELTEAFERKGNEEGLGTEWEQQRRDLEELWDLLIEKSLVVDRFVRVACPARGTTLVSKRIDYVASGLLNAVGLIPGIKGNPAIEIGYDWLKSLLLTLVKKRIDPKELPGIEAMSPDSPLIEFLNHTGLSTQADLGIIAGDIEVGNLKLSIPALIGNTFFWAKNDLVVNTKAMYDGIGRAEKAYFFFDQGSSVSHFNYFFNEETRTRVNGWLLRKDGDTDEFFREVRREEGRARDLRTVSDWLEQEEPKALKGPVYTLEVSILHGDLRFSRYPVAVGHYDGDGIVSAEKYLDRLLDGRLTDRVGMRLYPGPVGTAEVIYGAKDSTPGGALVIGLGDMGSINTAVVERGVMTAAVRHALAVAEQLDGKRERRFRSAAFSSLLIGTYGGNALRVKESVAAIVQGAINANRLLYLQNMWDRVRIDRIELVELYEDVAIQAVRAVHELSQDSSSDFAEEVTVKVEPGTIRSAGGGRYQRPVSDFETYWYGRIQITGSRAAPPPLAEGGLTRLSKIFSLDPDRQITQRYFVERLIDEALKTPKKRAQLSEIITELLTQDRAESGGDSGLEFLVLTDRARVEASLQGTQRRVIDLLVEQSINQTGYEKQLSVSLYELLVPNALKGRTENVVLILDRESAQYPWELMTDRTRPNEPLATRQGLLRQFKTMDFRANPQPSRGNQAIVIGDPINTGLAPLPGARAEAEAVAKLLRGAGYVVQDPINKDSKSIINDLFAGEYQILHVAAHGNYNQSAPDQSGVVLGDGIFLTAKEMVDLRTVPDLVFINCCHLGKVDRDQNARLETEYPHRLAASVAEELIKIGVKTVVAAGWAVEDTPGKEFAQLFYQKMLEGEAFGKAVLEARSATHKNHPGSNTWGAYQCYGNPNFRLNLQGGRGLPNTGFYSRREYRDELRSIAERPDVQDEASNRWARKRLVELDEQMQKQSSANNLIADGEVLADFGDAWTSLGNYEEAINFYRKSIRTKDAKVPLKAVERLANLHCRYALQLWERNRVGKVEGTRRKAQKLITEAKELFDWLLSLETTPERYTMMGKVYKCQALISETKRDREVNLSLAKEFYQKGYKAAQKRKESAKDWLFPATNYIACALLLPRPKINELTALIAEGQKALLESTGLNEEFRTRVLKPDLDLVLRLARGDLPRHQPKIIDAYRQAFATRVKPNDAYSLFSRINFLIEMLAADTKTGKKASMAKALGNIKSELLRLISSPVTS